MRPQHSVLFAPSAANMWGHCSGSASLNAGKKNVETIETKEGTAGHWVCSECLEQWKLGGPTPLCVDWVGKQAPNGIVITDEMAEGAQMFVDDVLKIAGKHGALRKMQIEQVVDMPDIHELNYGTFDAAIIVPGVIYLWDYKGGHRENEAIGNLQLVNYIKGIMNKVLINGLEDQKFMVHMRIVQPFAFHAVGPIREWVIRLSDLRGYFNQLRSKAQEAVTNPTLTPGIHCRDCVVVGKCAASRKAAYSVIQYANDPLSLDSMTGADLRAERDILNVGAKIIKARQEAIEDLIMHGIKNGDKTSGLVTEATTGRLSWTVEPPQAIAFAKNFGVDNGVTKPLTPTQTLAKAPKEIRQIMSNAIGGVATRKPGTKIIHVEDSLVNRAFRRK